MRGTVLDSGIQEQIAKSEMRRVLKEKSSRRMLGNAIYYGTCAGPT
jgi:hypothetical protein